MTRLPRSVACRAWPCSPHLARSTRGRWAPARATGRPPRTPPSPRAARSAGSPAPAAAARRPRGALRPAPRGRRPAGHRQGAARLSYPLRTDAPTGVVTVSRGGRYTLGDLFRVWGRRSARARCSRSLDTSRSSSAAGASPATHGMPLHAPRADRGRGRRLRRPARELPLSAGSRVGRAQAPPDARRRRNARCGACRARRRRSASDFLISQRVFLPYDTKIPKQDQEQLIAMARRRRRRAFRSGWR